MGLSESLPGIAVIAMLDKIFQLRPCPSTSLHPPPPLNRQPIFQINIVDMHQSAMVTAIQTPLVVALH